MAMMDEGRPRFETATRAAEKILDELREGDSVALVLTGGPVLPEQGKLFHTHETEREMLAQSRPSYERADLTAKLQQARRLLTESDAPNKEIYVITDNQAISWEGLNSETYHPPGSDGDDDDPQVSDVPVVLVDVHRQAAPNVALRGLHLDTPVRAVGVPVAATVEVFNASPVPRQQHVELYLDGTREAASPTLSVPPLSTVKHEFRFEFRTAGVHRGEVRLVGEDASLLDNRLFFAMAVDQQIPIAIVKPRRHEIAYLEDTFYLEQALAPAGASGWAIRATALTGDDLVTEPLSGYAVVFCVNLPTPGPPARDRLRDYVSGGGRLVWIGGDNVEPAAYNAMNEAASVQLLPVPLTEQRSATNRVAGDAESWHIGFLDADHPALTRLTEPASLYQSVLVHKHVRFESPDGSSASAGARVLARLDDGEPLLVERAVGSGRVLMLGTGVHLEWTNLPLKPLFLPLFARLTFYLAGSQTDSSQVLAGSPLSVPLRSTAAPGEMEIIRPSGESLRLPIEGAGAATFRYADTHQVGVYVLRSSGVALANESAFAVNPDPDESDPTIVLADDLKTHFGPHSLVVCGNPENIAATIRTLRQGESLWELFLSAVLVALVLESFLANRLGGRSGPPVQQLPPKPATTAEEEEFFAMLQGGTGN